MRPLIKRHTETHQLGYNGGAGDASQPTGAGRRQTHRRENHMRIPVMAAVIVLAVGCGPAISQTEPTEATSKSASPSPLTLETATCAESTEIELPPPEDVREARATDPDAYGPTDLRDLLHGKAAGAFGLKGQHWRGLVDALDADPAAQRAVDGTLQRFQYRGGGMEFHAVRIAEVWFISSETHAVPDSFCEGDEPS